MKKTYIEPNTEVLELTMGSSVLQHLSVFLDPRFDPFSPDMPIVPIEGDVWGTNLP